MPPDAAFPRYVTPAEHGGVDGRVASSGTSGGSLFVEYKEVLDDRLIREAGRWRFLRREAPTDIG